MIYKQKYENIRIKKMFTYLRCAVVSVYAWGVYLQIKMFDSTRSHHDANNIVFTVKWHNLQRKQVMYNQNWQRQIIYYSQQRQQNQRTHYACATNIHNMHSVSGKFYTIIPGKCWLYVLVWSTMITWRLNRLYFATFRNRNFYNFRY